MYYLFASAWLQKMIRYAFVHELNMIPPLEGGSRVAMARQCRVYSHVFLLFLLNI